MTRTTARKDSKPHAPETVRLSWSNWIAIAGIALALLGGLIDLKSDVAALKAVQQILLSHLKTPPQ